MKNLYILLALVFASFSVEAQLGVDTYELGADNSNNYPGANWTEANQGTGFSDWVFDSSASGVGFTGRFIGSFSPDLDINGNSFGLFANSDPGAFVGAATTFPKPLEEGDSFTTSIGVNFRDGFKGFDLVNSTNLPNSINFNVGNDTYGITGSPNLFGNAYDANTVFTITFTQNASDMSWTVVRSGGLSGTETGTIAGINPGDMTSIRFYNVSAGSNGDGGAGQRNLYINSLAFESTYTIANNSTVSVSGDTTVPYLDIQSGSTVNIPSTSNLTVSGDLNISGDLNLTSTSTEYPSLITNGATIGNITYNRFVNSNANGNDLIGQIAGGIQFSDFLTANAAALFDDGLTLPTTYAFGPFDKTTGDFVNWTDDDTFGIGPPGSGFRVATNSGETLAFTGFVNTGLVATGISNSGPAFEEWNLIGNPYPSYLNVQDFLNNSANAALLDETNVGIYGYDGSALNGWTILNLANTTSTTVITPGQGFFVAAEADGNIEFTNSMRQTGTADDFIQGFTANELVYVKVKAITDNNNYTTDFYFNNNASQGLDPGYDAGLWGGTPSNFSIYSNLVQENQGKSMAIQALSMADLNDVTIPLGMHANQGEQLTFSIADMNIPASVNVYLEDVVANTVTLLNTTDYVITPTSDLSGTGRFFLRTSDESLSTIENSSDTLNIFALHVSKELIISGQLQDDSNLSVFDMQGRNVLSVQLDSTSIENRIDTSEFTAGVYVVTVENNGQQKTQKVILK